MAWRGSATTIATTMSPRRSDRWRRLLRWLMAGAIVTLAPKCVLCVIAYLGLGTTLGWTSAELCGAPASKTLPGIAWLVATKNGERKPAYAVNREGRNVTRTKRLSRLTLGPNSP